jgi:DNA polymerase III subunit beta
MKIQIETTQLTAVLQKVINITDKRTNIPILSNILVKALDQDTIEISATDLEISFCTEVRARIENPGMTTVSARKLLEVVRELPYEGVTLEGVPDSRLLVHSGRARFELQTISAEDFPHLNFHEGSEFSKCNASLLRNALGKTLYGVPSEEDHFSVAGLYWHFVEPDFFRFVSCDGHRLAYFDIPEASLPKLNVPKGIIVPRKGAQEIIRMLEREDEAFLSFDENCLILKASGTVLSVQLLDAEFPEYQVIIPDERPFSVELNWEAFHSALKRMAVLTNPRWRHVRFTLKENLLELQAGDPEVGNADDMLDVDYQGEEFVIAFNVKYILETLQSIESEKIRFEWLDAFHGGVFVGPDDPNYFSLIMPMIVS